MEQKDGSSIILAVRSALQQEPELNLARWPIRLEYEEADGALIMEGDVEDISHKKLALERAAAVRGVNGIVDRLHVIPAQQVPDEALRIAVLDALLQEPALEPFALTVRVGARVEPARVLGPDARGWIEVRVNDGVVTLDGEVSGLTQKRLAGVLAWWVPGARDVVNGLGVTPPEEDNDDEITDAVAIVLEKDPFVNAGQLRVHTSSSVVILDGMVHSAEERDMAERDAWYVFGVDKVENHVLVAPAAVVG